MCVCDLANMPTYSDARVSHASVERPSDREVEGHKRRRENIQEVSGEQQNRPIL